MQERLYNALRAGDANAVKAAIANGADVNEPHQHSSGTDPSLRLAIEYPEIIRILVEHGADPNAVDAPNGSNPLTYAAHKGQSESAALLIAAGANPNHADLAGFTPLGDAAFKGTPAAIEVMRVLLKGGADIEGGVGSTPLMMASRSAPAMKFLIDHGANVNATRPRQGTALHVCIENKNLAGIQLLLSRGADPSIPGPGTDSKPGPTALEFARKKKFKKAIELLEGGAQPAPAVDLPAILDKLLKKKTYGWLPPATDAELAELSAFAGAPLPKAVVDIYSRANGQKPNAKKPFLAPADFLDAGWYLSPIEEVIDTGRTLAELLDRGEFAGTEQEVLADAGVRQEWWNRGWLPMFGDGGGDHVCIDFDPAASGKVGQVIEFHHDSGERKRRGESLESYIGELDLK